MDKQTLLEITVYLESALKSIERALEHKDFHMVETELANARLKLRHLYEIIKTEKENENETDSNSNQPGPADHRATE
jgi:hypothetical protein